MYRVSFYIDGFNLYHSLKDNAKDCRWLDLRKLCESKISKDKEVISDIYYFSALATWSTNADTVAKHKKYINRLEQESIKVILGKFKEKETYCPKCNQTFIKHEEKQTDVNIALKLVTDGFKDKYDTAILISGDTDMIPAILSLKENKPEKRIGVIFPIRRKTLELESVVNFSRKLSRKNLVSCLFESDTAPEGWIPSNFNSSN